MYNFNDFNFLYVIIIVVVILYIINFICELIDFKKFAKKYYYIDIKIVPFIKQLILLKLKRHN